MNPWQDVFMLFNCTAAEVLVIVGYHFDLGTTWIGVGRGAVEGEKNRMTAALHFVTHTAMSSQEHHRCHKSWATHLLRRF